VRHEYEDMKNVFFINRFLSLQAKEALNSVEVDHHRLRIDYSVTKRAHTPSNYFQLLIFITVFFCYRKAPGIYMGVRTTSYHRSNGHRDRRSPSPDKRSHHRRHHHHHRRHDNSSRFVLIH
jgi:hypothetical protein